MSRCCIGSQIIKMYHFVQSFMILLFFVVSTYPDSTNAVAIDLGSVISVPENYRQPENVCSSKQEEAPREGTGSA